MTAGRPPTTPPATAEDRAMALVIVLAASAGDYQLRALCAAWAIEPVINPEVPRSILMWPTVHKLAQHALAYGRDEGA